jgi:hypothetical protein
VIMRIYDSVHSCTTLRSIPGFAIPYNAKVGWRDYARTSRLCVKSQASGRLICHQSKVTPDAHWDMDHRQCSRQCWLQL